MNSKLFVTLVVFASLLLGGAVFAQGPNSAAQANLSEKETEWLQQIVDETVEPAKRVKAAQELAKSDCKAAKDNLLEMMKTDDTYQGRIVAAKALLDLGCKDALEAVEKQAENDESPIVRNALKGIAKRMHDLS